MTSPVAVVASACEFADASTPAELWATVLHGRRCFRHFPPQRLALADYMQAEPGPDGIYAIEAALLEGWRFDREAFRVPQPAFERTDMAHWLALDVATRTLGGLDPATLHAERDETAVIVANTLTGEFSRANLMRYRWPWVERLLRGAAAGQLSEAAVQALVQRVEANYKAPFPAPDEDSLAGGLANTIAGRIANQHGLRGGAHSVDGACASSLVAIINACERLAQGDVGCVLVGAVDLSLDPFELVGFARNGALAHDLMRVFDAHADGFWPGEGCGFVLLARADVVARHGWPVLAWIRAAAMSSDGQGALTRPTVDGQWLAAQRAWSRAGLAPATADYFEAHGTGTPTGDQVELQGLARLIGAAAPPRPIAVGSIKANIGHTKAAAGMAGLLKAIAVCRERVIPPTTGCLEPHPLLQGELAAHLAVPWKPAAVAHSSPITVGVSSFGFGGVNCHVVVQGASTTAAPSATAWPAADASALAGELFTLHAESREALAARLRQLAARAMSLSRAQVADLAHALCHEDGAGWRACVVAATPPELAAAAAATAAALAADAPWRLGENWAWAAPRSGPPRIALLCPGQGLALPLRCTPWRRRFPTLTDASTRAERLAVLDRSDTAVVQPLLAELALAGLQLLREFEIKPAIVFGHSFGELCALHAAGCLDAEALRALALARGQCMRDLAPEGAMVSLQTTHAIALELAVLHGVDLACDNAPVLQVLSGATPAITALEISCQTQGVACTRLGTTRAFHSRSMAVAREALRSHLSGLAWRTGALPVASTITGRLLDSSEALADLLADQLLSPVRFRAAVAALGPVDLVLELGPGSGLAELMQANGVQPTLALGVFAATASPLLLALGAAWVLGADVRREALFSGRPVRACRIDELPLFLSNPCGVPDQAPPLLAPPQRAAPAAEPVAAMIDADALDILRQVVAELSGLAVVGLTPELRLLSDLHLNSIRARHALALAARRLGLSRLPFDLARQANASLGEAAAALQALQRELAPADEVAPPGIAPWLRLFAHDWRDATPIPPHVGIWGCPLKLLDALAPLPEASRALLNGASPPRCVLLTLPAVPSGAVWRALLDAARLVIGGVEGLLVVQQAQLANAFVRSLAAEWPQRRCCAVQVQTLELAALQQAIAEYERCTQGYSEVRLCDGQQQRRGLAALPAADPRPLWQPGPGSLVLVSGGARGIGAACALALAAHYGCRMALVGRSPANAEEVTATLAALHAQGSDAAYYSADLRSPEQTQRVVATIRADQGEVSVLVHAAGVNHPGSLATLEEAEFEATLASKLGALENLLACLPRLRLLVGFGSIIGEIGLAGEAHYALANEWLQLRLAEHGRTAGDCRVLAIAWSAWREVGMAARLDGVLDSLQAADTRALSTVEGTGALLRLLSLAAPLPVVVAGRHGLGFDAAAHGPRLQRHRYLEHPRVFYPGIELVADAALCSDADRYLHDHAPLGVPVLPLVCAIEAMVSAAQCLWQSDEMPAIEDLHIGQALSCSIGQRFVLRTAALLGEDGVVRAELRSETTGFEVAHFSARLLRRARAGLGRARPAEVDASWPAGELLYRGLCFHGPRFQRLRCVHSLNATHCVVQTLRNAPADWYGPLLPQAFAGGDAGVRDAALHALQLCVPHQLVLPVGAARVELGRLDAQGEYRIQAWQVSSAGGRFVFDIEIAGEDGELLERWHGLQLVQTTAGSAREQSAPSLAPALLPSLVARIASDVLGAAEVCAGVGADTRRALEQALGHGLTLMRRANGAPLTAAAQVSSSHGAGLTVALARPRGPLSIDLQAAPECSLDDWRLMLGAALCGWAEQIAKQAQLPMPQALLMTWTLAECLQKLGRAAQTMAPAACSRAETTQLGPLLVFELAGLRLAVLSLRISDQAAPVALAIALEDLPAVPQPETALAEGRM